MHTSIPHEYKAFEAGLGGPGEDGKWVSHSVFLVFIYHLCVGNLWTQ